ARESLRCEYWGRGVWTWTEGGACREFPLVVQTPAAHEPAGAFLPVCYFSRSGGFGVKTSGCRWRRCRPLPPCPCNALLYSIPLENERRALCHSRRVELLHLLM